MARIRSVKPEFWTSPQVAACSPLARLLFIGFWNFADDHGVHPNSPLRLRASIFPDQSISETDFLALIGELVSGGLLDAYAVDGRHYLRVTGWAKHQRIDNPCYRFPMPSPVTSEEIASRSLPATPRIGREGKGGEGIGMESQESMLRETRNAPPDKPKERKSGNGLNAEAVAILEFLNAKTGRAFRPVPATLKLIHARLLEGATPTEMRQVIALKAREWRTDEKMAKYLRPATLFNATKFANYQGELVEGPPRA